MRQTATVVLLTLVTAAHAMAQTAEAAGQRIAAEASRRASGFSDMSATLLLVIRNGRGSERERELSLTVLETPDEGTRSVVRFNSPRDLRGTALLTVDNEDGSSDQWLYLPALRRVKRLGGTARSGSFMGSEFAYEDVSVADLERYRYRLTEVDTLDGVVSWVVERTPTNESSQYARQLVWIDQVEYCIHRIDFYDDANSLLKTLELKDYRLYLERFWRPSEMSMVNHRTGATTLLRWSEIAFDTGLAAHEFEPNRLARGA